MEYTKGNVESNNASNKAGSWVFGIVITGMLPYMVMLISWIADEFSNSLIFYYTGIADTAAFMYSASFCLLLLCLDYKKIEKNVPSICIYISVFFVIISVLLYGFTTKSNVEKEIELKKLKTDESIMHFIQQNELTSPLNIKTIIMSLIMSVITIWVVCQGYRLIQKHEKENKEETNIKAEQECK